MQALTTKQAKVRDLVALGWSNKEIAQKLGISRRTVEDHRAEIYDRMNVRNAVELVRKMLGATV
jgi:DNA-binding NarL/FixJ family response regulator